jgi:hypothetical protein
VSTIAGVTAVAGIKSRFNSDSQCMTSALKDSPLSCGCKLGDIIVVF